MVESNALVMVRAYRTDGKLYAVGWTTLLTLWDKSYISQIKHLEQDGRTTMVLGQGTVEMILVG